MSSMIGRPNMDENLEGDQQMESSLLPMPHVEADDGDDDEDALGDSCEGSDDWGDLTIRGEALNAALQTVVQRHGGVDDLSATGMMFVPEPVMSLNNDSKPQMPLLPQEQLEPGVDVWVVDEDDVKMLLKDHWDGVLKSVCNGRASGKLLRHSTDDLAVVLFENDALAIKYTFTLPRVCLSKEPIVAYESPKTRGHGAGATFAQSIGGVGNLGPRAGRGNAKTHEEVNLFQQHYELMASYSVKCPTSEGAWSLLMRGKLNDALSEIDRAIGDDVVGEFRKEHYCVRSSIQLFRGQHSAALNDALEVIKLNPSWVKGYLRAARAYKAHGKYTLASHMINQSLLLLPHSSELLEVSSMNDFLRRQQLELETSFPLSLRLNAYYMKRFVTKRGFQVGETLFQESDWILAMPSMFNKSDCCCVCLGTRNLSVMKLPTKQDAQDTFCSTACHQRSSLFFPMERDDNEIGFRSALSLIQAKAASSMNMLPLELARLTMRLFLVVCTTHKRLVAQSRHAQQQQQQHMDSDVTLDDALLHLGIFPLVSTTGMETKTRDDLIILCNVMCQGFEARSRATYSPQLFIRLFAFVSAYALFAESPGSGDGLSTVKGYYVGRLCGSVERRAEHPNCEVRIGEEGFLRLVATTEILKEDALVIASLSTTQH